MRPTSTLVPTEIDPSCLARTEHAADQEVAAPELGLVLVDDDADLQPLGQQQPLVVGQRLGHLGEPLERGLAAELADDVVLRVGDDVRAPDRPATLRHHGAHARRPAEQHADRAVAAQLAVEREPVPARARARPRPCPPMTCRSGRSSASRVTNASTGNVNGSVSSSNVCGSSVASSLVTVVRGSASR